MLDSYAAERLPISQKLLLGTGLAPRFMLVEQPWLQQVRSLVPTAVSRLAPLRHQLIETITELSVRHRDSPIVLSEPALPLSRHIQKPALGTWIAFQQAPKAGDGAPDGEVETQQGPKRLAQLFSRELKHTLLLFAGTANPSHTHLAQTAQALVDTFAQDILVHLVLPTNQISEATVWPGSVVLDHQSHCHQKYGASRECLYLIRPDDYIGYCSQSAIPNYLHSHFQRYLQNLKAPLPNAYRGA